MTCRARRCASKAGRNATPTRGTIHEHSSFYFLPLLQMATVKRNILDYEEKVGRRSLTLRRQFNSALLQAGAKRKKGEDHPDESPASKKTKNKHGKQEYACETKDGKFTGRTIPVSDCKGNNVFKRVEDENGNKIGQKEMRYRPSGTICEESESALDCTPVDKQFIVNILTNRGYGSDINILDEINVTDPKNRELALAEAMHNRDLLSRFPQFNDDER